MTGFDRDGLPAREGTVPEGHHASDKPVGRFADRSGSRWHLLTCLP